MNLDELRSVQSKERQKDSLQNLRPSFYQEVGEYIAELEDERDRAAEQADDPFSSPEVSRLTDEIETAKDVVEAIYERRMGKLVKQASLAAAGMAANDDGLTAEEADLFDDLVDRIDANKTRVLDVLEGVEAESEGVSETDDALGADAGTTTESDPAPDAPNEDSDPDSIAKTGTPDAPPMEPDPTAETADRSDEADVDPTTLEPDDDPRASDASEVTAADVMGGDPPTDPDEDTLDPDAATSSQTDGPENETESAPGEDVDSAVDEPDDAEATAASGDDLDRITVRMTRDVGSILGVDDREYTLSADDVITLPEQNASPLLERDAAERLD
ncbi:DNA replication complex subunit Gins51 [Natronococcus occultus]|uniref:Uncharacterized protein n=1 Tax=Natronococcus occultus SP4 TaxID=694430 RepID=L0JZT9_9EURY|nr:hypothetical protein [Natronococcus occultus]AGB37624.1 hypothetical protein Natoc_1829 [Natronococcus occultus SP4]